jgi:hypothetical protein
MGVSEIIGPHCQLAKWPLSGGHGLALSLC